MNTSFAPRKTMARKPSHFGSKRYSPEAGSLSVSLASIGSIGGAIGKSAAFSGAAGSVGGVFFVSRRGLMSRVNHKLAGASPSLLHFQTFLFLQYPDGRRVPLAVVVRRMT